MDIPRSFFMYGWREFPNSLYPSAKRISSKNTCGLLALCKMFNEGQSEVIHKRVPDHLFLEKICPKSSRCGVTKKSSFQKNSEIKNGANWQDQADELFCEGVVIRKWTILSAYLYWEYFLRREGSQR